MTARATVLAMRIVTWNVLHRTHAENWRESVPDRYPDERARIAEVTARVRALVSREEAAICLQEVSGDQLASLQATFGAAAVHAFCYPRVPRLRDASAAQQLTDPREFLVTIAPAAAAGRGLAFDNDPGKGALAVPLRAMVLVNAHFTFGEARAPQVRQALSLAGDGACVLCGDCNAGADLVGAELGAGFVVAPMPEGSLPTRPREAGSKPPAIDHVFGRGVELSQAEVVDARGVSDHNPVVTAVGLASRASTGS
jgi:hypothetical protein